MTQRRKFDPEKTRFEHLKQAEEDMQLIANEMGAMTPGELGQYTKGWAGTGKKKKKVNTYLQQNYNYASIELNYNHNHDARGRFASGGGGGSVSGGGSEKEDYIKSGGKHREWMREAAKFVIGKTNENGGGTFQFDKDGNPEAVKNGIMVADHPEKGEIKSNINNKDAAKYIDKHAGTLDKDHALGTWQNEGKTYLDVVRIFPLNQESAAIKAGIAANQIAIGKLVNGVYSEIPTGGTGEIS